MMLSSRRQGLALGLVCGLGWSLVLGGCASRTGGTAGGGTMEGPVDQVYLVALPVALNLDAFPGNDGFAIKVYVGNRVLPKTFPIKAGTLEVVVHDGLPTSDASRDPLRVWRFTPQELQPHEIRGAVGTGYSFTLKWEAAAPRERKITVFARYSPAEGRTVSSAVTLISVAD